MSVFFSAFLLHKFLTCLKKKTDEKMSLKTTSDIPEKFPILPKTVIYQIPNHKCQKGLPIMLILRILIKIVHDWYKYYSISFLTKTQTANKE